MGAALSHVQHHARKALVRVILRVLCVVSSTISSLVNRLAASPGIPVSHPSPSYWTVPPSPIAKHGSASNAFIPEYADIVIIGSGITGTSIARTILDYDANTRGTKRPLQVVMLEARDACSGATGRYVNRPLKSDTPEFIFVQERWSYYTCSVSRLYRAQETIWSTACCSNYSLPPVSFN